MILQPLVSIIVPVYNAEQFLSLTLDSILQQTYQNWEAILVDNLSTDQSPKLIKEYCAKDSRFKSMVNSKAQGVSSTRNIGISEAQGEYVTFLDSDDLWDADKIEKQLDFMVRNNHTFTYTNYRKIDTVGNKIKGGRVISPLSINYSKMLQADWIGTLTVMLKFDRKIIFSEDLRTGEDYLLWLQLLKDGTIGYNLDQDLASYRIGASSLSANKIQNVRNNWKMFRDKLELSLLKSFICVFCNIIVKLFIKK